jgi:hypothetical protein
MVGLKAASNAKGSGWSPPVSTASDARLHEVAWALAAARQQKNKEPEPD